MKLMKGKQYVRRDGTISPPLELVDGEHLYDPETDYIFSTRDFVGSNLVYGMGMEEDKDLMSEHVPAPNTPANP